MQATLFLANLIWAALILASSPAAAERHSRLASNEEDNHGSNEEDDHGGVIVHQTRSCTMSCTCNNVCTTPEGSHQHNAT